MSDLEDFDTSDSSTDEREEPTRSEPVDFGGGETTGVQDLAGLADGDSEDMDEPTEPRRLEEVMSDDDPVELGDVVTFPEDATDCVDGDNQRWIVLHSDDYENHAVDVDGNVGVLVGPEQTRELYRLCVTTMLALEHPDGGEGVIRDLIGTLEEVIDE